MTKDWLKTLIVGVALALTSTMASAITLFPGTTLTAGTLLEDDDVDYYLPATGNTTGLISVGDRLLAPLEITKIIDILAPLQPSVNLALTPEELTGISFIQVVNSLATDPAGRIRFGAPSAADWLATTGLVVPEGTMAVFFVGTGATNDLDVTGCTSQADCLSKAINGALYLTLGLADPDDEWFFDPLVAGANSPLAVSLVGAASKVGVVNFALSQLGGIELADQSIGILCGALFQCAGDGITAVVGSADILGGAGLANGAFARSDADFTINVVPEPGTLSLVGLLLGLLGLGATFRRRRMS